MVALPDVEVWTDTLTFIQLACGRIDPHKPIDLGTIVGEATPSSGNGRRNSDSPCESSGGSRRAHRTAAPPLTHSLGRRSAQIVGGVASPTGTIKKRPATDSQPSTSRRLERPEERPVDLDSPIDFPWSVAVRTTSFTSVDAQLPSGRRDMEVRTCAPLARHRHEPPHRAVFPPKNSV